MSWLNLLIPRTIRVLIFIYNILTPKALAKLYVESTIPLSALNAIRLIKLKRGWVWKGEYNVPSDASYPLELIMYNVEGAIRILEIDGEGAIKYVYPKGNLKFFVC